jgi:uncharacterized protein YkvS
MSGGWERFKLQASTIQADVKTLMSNHVYHLQESLDELNGTVRKLDDNVTGMRDDARTYFLAGQKK